MHHLISLQQGQTSKDKSSAISFRPTNNVSIGTDFASTISDMITAIEPPKPQSASQAPVSPVTKANSVQTKEANKRDVNAKNAKSNAEKSHNKNNEIDKAKADKADKLDKTDKVDKNIDHSVLGRFEEKIDEAKLDKLDNIDKLDDVDNIDDADNIDDTDNIDVISNGTQKGEVTTGEDNNLDTKHDKKNAKKDSEYASSEVALIFAQINYSESLQQGAKGISKDSLSDESLSELTRLLGDDKLAKIAQDNLSDKDVQSLVDLAQKSPKKFDDLVSQLTNSLEKDKNSGATQSLAILDTIKSIKDIIDKADSIKESFTSNYDIKRDDGYDKSSLVLNDIGKVRSTVAPQVVSSEITAVKSVNNSQNIVMPTAAQSTKALPQFQLSLKQGVNVELNTANTANMVQKFAPLMGQQLMTMIGKGIQQAEIRLDPPELGSMLVKIQVQEGQTQVQFHVMHNQTRDLLEQSMPKLREMLAEEGMNLSDSQISQQNQNQNQQDEQQTEKKGNNFIEEPKDLQNEIVTKQIKVKSGIDYYA